MNCAFRCKKKLRICWLLLINFAYRIMKLTSHRLLMKCDLNYHYDQSRMFSRCPYPACYMVSHCPFSRFQSPRSWARIIHYIGTGQHLVEISYHFSCSITTWEREDYKLKTNTLRSVPHFPALAFSNNFVRHFHVPQFPFLKIQHSFIRNLKHKYTRLLLDHSVYPIYVGSYIMKKAYRADILDIS